MPSVAALSPSPPAAAMGAGSAAAFPSAASITPAGATSASSAHLPVSATLGAGSAAPAASEEMVSTVNTGAHVGKRAQNLLVYWRFLT